MFLEICCFRKIYSKSAIWVEMLSEKKVSGIVREYFSSNRGIKNNVFCLFPIKKTPTCEYSIFAIFPINFPIIPYIGAREI